MNHCPQIENVYKSRSWWFLSISGLECTFASPSIVRGEGVQCLENAALEEGSGSAAVRDYC